MRHRPTRIARAALLTALTALALVPLANGAGARDPKAKDFVGYWMGTDPLDGGDSRRGITENDDGTLSMAGRDSFLSLCDETDRGIATFDDAALTGSGLTTDELVLACFDNGATVTLKAAYTVLDRGMIVETVRTQDDALVTEIVFFRVSDDR